MNIWEWKKSKLVRKAWKISYSDSLNCNIFCYGRLIIREDLVRKLSFMTLDALRLYELGVVSDAELLGAFDTEDKIKNLTFAELNELKDSIKWKNI